MVNEATGPINFAMFLTLFGQKMNGTDSEEVINDSFASFDDNRSGKINSDELRDLLMSMGDRMSHDEVEDIFRDAPIDRQGGFDYKGFTQIMKHGEKEKEEEE